LAASERVAWEAIMEKQALIPLLITKAL